MSDPLFRLEDVSFAYDSERPVLDGVGLELAPGERLALLGANGSGKTTLLHVMVGLLGPISGSVLAFGRPRKLEKDFIDVRAKAGLLFQDPDDQLFCPTVGEDVAFGPLNLGLGTEEARAVAVSTLASLGLEGFADRVTYKLSGGEKRMVTLATVLAMRPEVLLLDEPSGGLDDRALERLLATLEKLPQAMVIVSHDQRVVDRLATRRVRLENGKIPS